MKTKIQVGDTVKYAAKFLKSIACHTEPLCFAKGEVLEVREYSKGFKLARINWDCPDCPELVNVGNLILSSRPEYPD